MAIVASLGALLVVSVQPAVAQAMKLAAESLDPVLVCLDVFSSGIDCQQ